MSQEQVSVAPRRRSPAEAAQLVAEYEASGVSRREFCGSRGLAISTLDAYRRGQRQKQREGACQARLVAVEVSSPRPAAAGAAANVLAVVLENGRRIEVGRGFDAGTLEQLLPLLERV